MLTVYRNSQLLRSYPSQKGHETNISSSCTSIVHAYVVKTIGFIVKVLNGTVGIETIIPTIVL
jgi:hypothetical protein